MTDSESTLSMKEHRTEAVVKNAGPSRTSTNGGNNLMGCTVKVDERYLDDRPVIFSEWSKQMEKHVKDVIALYVFNCVKFIESTKDLENSRYLGVIFQKLNHQDPKNWTSKAFRSKYWSSIVEYTKDHIRDMRNKVVAKSQKMVKGKSWSV